MIKRAAVILVLLFTGSIFSMSLSAQVINDSKPLKGDWDFKLEKQWSVSDVDDNVLIDADTVRVDSDSKIYVFDSKHFKFFVFSKDGKLLNSFGKRGEGPGELKMVNNFLLVGNSLIVPDFGKIHYFTKGGKYLRSVTPGFQVFARTFVDEHRFVMVTADEDEKSETEKMELYDTRSKERTLIHKITKEKDIVASSGGLELRFKDSNTTPMLVVTVSDDQLIFAKNDSYEFQKTNMKGKVTDFFRVNGKKRRAIPEAVKRQRFENITVNGGKMPEHMIKAMIKQMPDICTYFGAIRVADSGLLYVYINDMTNENGQELDIFSPEGKYLYHSKVTLPDGLKPVSSMQFKGDSMVVFAEDEEGERQLIKYKITTPSI